jgi:hypothetical protein
MEDTYMEVKDWIRTYTGKQFHFAKPALNEVALLDIAVSLSRKCRFSAHSKVFYSVAQHACLIHDYLLDQGEPLEVAFAGLNHDDGEAYLVDVPRPVKVYLREHMGFFGFDDIEDSILWSVFNKYNILWPIPKAVWDADNAMLATEMAQLMPVPEDYKGASPIPGLVLEPWSEERARQEFLERFRKHRPSAE